MCVRSCIGGHLPNSGVCVCVTGIALSQTVVCVCVCVTRCVRQNATGAGLCGLSK